MPKIIKAKENKKNKELVKTAKIPIKAKKKALLEEGEELVETPVLEQIEHDDESKEILALLSKKATPKAKPVGTIDYIPELERADEDLDL